VKKDNDVKKCKLKSFFYLNFENIRKKTILSTKKSENMVNYKKNIDYLLFSINSMHFPNIMKKDKQLNHLSIKNM